MKDIPLHSNIGVINIRVMNDFEEEKLYYAKEFQLTAEEINMIQDGVKLAFVVEDSICIISNKDGEK